MSQADSPEPPAIHVSGLRKSYRDHVAVADIDLTVPRGEIFALLGPNGAGKTSTVEVLEGYRRRDGGAVSVLGTDPAHPTSAWRCRVGIVLQSTGEFEELTVAEVVRHFARYYPNPANPDSVIERVGLAGKHRSRTRALSGGQQRRLDVALGIVGRPDLLFLDEPTTGFDPQARREFWQLIRDLATGGTTILLTTHYLDEAEHLADRVGVIADGRMVDVASPDRLGGRHRAPTTVSWQGAEPGSVATRTPAAVVGELAARFGGEVPGLAVHRPSLEDIYLDMISAKEAA